MKYKQYKLVNHNRFVATGLILTLIATGAIAKIKNARAEDISPSTILSTQSIYIANRSINTLNIYPERPKYNINLSEEYQDLIYELSMKNGLSYEFALAVFHYESKFDPKATNKNRDKSIDEGFSQLNSRFTNTYRDYAVRYGNLDPNVQFDVFNIDHSIRAGIGTLVYLRDYWKQRGVSEENSLEYITGSFNLGIEGMKKYIRQTGKIEREYSRQVQKRKDMLEISNTL